MIFAQEIFGTFERTFSNVRISHLEHLWWTVYLPDNWVLSCQLWDDNYIGFLDLGFRFCSSRIDFSENFLSFVQGSKLQLGAPPQMLPFFIFHLPFILPTSLHSIRMNGSCIQCAQQLQRISWEDSRKETRDPDPFIFYVWM